MTGTATPPGEPLGHLEYLIDHAARQEYRRLVDACAQYPNLAADDCRTLLLNHGGQSLPLTPVWQQFHFLRPPVPGRRLQVAGWLRERRERDGRPWLRVAAFAVDEIGTEILRSQAAFVIGKPAAAENPGKAHRPIPPAAPGSLADAAVGDCLTLGRLALPDGAELADYRRLRHLRAGPAAAGNGDGDDDSSGLAALLAGWLEGRLGRHFGPDFHWGGRLAVAHHFAPEPGAALSGDATVIECVTTTAGVVTRRSVISVWNQSPVRIVTGEAIVKSPSPRLL